MNMELIGLINDNELSSIVIMVILSLYWFFIRYYFNEKKRKQENIIKLIDELTIIKNEDYELNKQKIFCRLQPFCNNIDQFKNDKVLFILNNYYVLNGLLSYGDMFFKYYEIDVAKEKLVLKDKYKSKTKLLLSLFFFVVFTYMISMAVFLYTIGVISEFVNESNNMLTLPAYYGVFFSLFTCFLIFNLFNFRKASDLIKCYYDAKKFNSVNI